MNQEYVVIELPGNKMLMLCLITRHYLNHADNTHVANQEEVLAYLNGLFEAVFISFRKDVSPPGEYKKLRLKRNSAKLLPKILDVYIQFFTGLVKEIGTKDVFDITSTRQLLVEIAEDIEYLLACKEKKNA